jgi:hypothetical protein
MIKATAVLITREKEYPKEVLASLPEFDEVIIETECPNVYRRYELAMQAKNDLIYVQDDDCLVDVMRLYQSYNGKITNYLTPHHYRSYQTSGITLIGWGAFFPKKMLNFDKYLGKFGMNPLLLSQADRVFTYLNQPHNIIVTDVNHLPRATDETRMYVQPDHWNNLNKISEQLISLQN